jgi:hypothetical protein
MVGTSKVYRGSILSIRPKPINRGDFPVSSAEKGIFLCDYTYPPENTQNIAAVDLSQPLPSGAVDANMDRRASEHVYPNAT